MQRSVVFTLQCPASSAEYYGFTPEEFYSFLPDDPDFQSTITEPRNRANTRPLVSYCIFQLEKAPTTGSLHYQGFAKFTEPYSITRIRELLPFLSTAYIAKRLGTEDEARDYCKKPDTRVAGPWEFGTFTGQGHRSDLDTVVNIFKSGGDRRQVATELPGMFIRYHAGIAAYESLMQDLPRDKDFQPREWQQEVLNMLADEPNDRNILWVYDSVGNQGKSRLTRHLLCEHGAISLTGSLNDMKYGYMQKKARVVIFDVTRAQADHTDHLYSMAEFLKNGSYFNTKYTSCMVVFKPPHVIFFSNSMPQEGKWSDDRVIIKTLA